jgi:energy-coupling factor transporter transmembrane protein EcfT
MKTLSIISLILFYLLSFLPVFGSQNLLVALIIAGVFWLAILFLLLIKKNKIWKRHLLFSPVIIITAFYFFKSIITYSIGSGTLMLNTKASNINFFSSKDFDYENRLYYHDYKGEHYGPISFLGYGNYYGYLVNDGTLKLLVSAFGYQAKMYKGKFPDKKDLYNAFATEKFEKVLLDEAANGYAKFTYRGNAIKLYKKANNESCLKGEGGYSLLEDVRIPIDSNTFSVNTKAMRKGASINIISKYYPLLYNVYNFNGEDFEFQIIDAENEKIITRHRFESSNPPLTPSPK